MPPINRKGRCGIPRHPALSSLDLDLYSFSIGFVMARMSKRGHHDPRRSVRQVNAELFGTSDETFLQPKT